MTNTRMLIVLILPTEEMYPSSALLLFKPRSYFIFLDCLRIKKKFLHCLFRDDSNSLIYQFRNDQFSNWFACQALIYIVHEKERFSFPSPVGKCKHIRTWLVDLLLQGQLSTLISYFHFYDILKTFWTRIRSSHQRCSIAKRALSLQRF